MRPRDMMSAQRRDSASGEGSSFFRQVIAELRRSTWPSREEAMRLTLMVVAIATAMGLFLWLMDYIFDFVIRVFVTGS